MSDRLEANEIQKRLGESDGWRLEGAAIQKQYVFDSFMPAIGFVNRVAALAEAADHHPDIAVQYKKVTMTLSTHSAGGLTQKDFDLARQMDSVVRG